MLEARCRAPRNSSCSAITSSVPPEAGTGYLGPRRNGVGTLPLEVRLVSSSLWRVSDAVMYDAARDAAALALSRIVTSPTALGQALDLRAAVDAVDGFDRPALEALISRPSHDLTATHSHE